MLRHTVRFARGYVLSLWRWYLAGTAAVLLTNWMSVAIPGRMADGLDAMRAGDYATGGREALWIGLLGLAIIVTRTVSRVWFFTPGRLAEFNLREALFAHCLKLQPDFYARMSTGDLMSRVATDVTYARSIAGFALLQAVNVAAALGMGIGKMLMVSPILTVATILPMLGAYVGMQLGATRLMRIQRLAQVQLATLSDELLGSLQGVAAVQGFCVEDVFVDRLTSRAADLRASNLAMSRLRVMVFPLLSISGGLAVFALLWLGGRMALAGTLSAGQIVGFVSLVVYVLMPMRLLGWLLPVFQRAETSLERIHVVIDSVPERPDLPTPTPFPTQVGPRIELRDLTFQYPDGARPVLEHVSVTLPAGGTIGIFGRTGSGKSTLLRVLSRLRNPPKGTVFVDGVDLTTIELGDLRAHLTLVPQTPFLFSETIRENVGLGAPDSEVRVAVAASSLEPDLAALPQGLDTIVGERGISLSGGQRQRTALARGLVRPRPIVLLDDVLSAVDHHTERELLGTLRARSDATRLIVSHRLSALEGADLILVLEEGRLVDQGRHDELIERPGPYRDAWLAQREEAA